MIAVGAITILGAAATQVQPAYAVKALGGCLIDKDLEVALKNHFQKRFFNLIDASDKQQEEISGLIDKQMEAARPIRQNIREQLLDLSDLMADSNSTDEQLKAKIESIRESRKQIQDSRTETALKIRSVLSADQKKLVSAKLKGFLTGNPRLGLLDR